MYRPPQAIRGAKLPLRPMHVWAIRVRLQIERRLRDLALFDIALDSQLRGYDVVSLRLPDVLATGAIKRRAVVVQQKTGRPVQFEITEQARQSLADWLRIGRGDPDGWLFPSRMVLGAHLSTRQYIRLAKGWIVDRPGASRVRQPQPKTDEGVHALSEDRQPQSVPAAARPYKVGKHRPLLGSGLMTL